MADGASHHPPIVQIGRARATMLAASFGPK
jgi:hypothetical protein